MSLVSGTGDGTGWIGAHVGDVRILSRSPDGTLRLETRDHTPAFAKWEAGEISLDEIPDTSGANRLQRAIGRGGEADVSWMPARPGWSWLIVSDGIYKAMRLDELGRVMEEPSAGAAVEAIRQKVLERGPDDNFTAVLVRALADSQPTPVLHDRTLPMNRATAPPPAAPPRRSGSAPALALALVALLASLAALGLLWQGRSDATARADEIGRLRAEVDSLEVLVRELRAPFGPTLPGDSLGGPDSVSAADTAPVTPTVPAP
jgi:hypothetical protein